jgi:hypothetical protein
VKWFRSNKSPLSRVSLGGDKAKSIDASAASDVGGERGRKEEASSGEGVPELDVVWGGDRGPMLM